MKKPHNSHDPSGEFRPYTVADKRRFAATQAHENASVLTAFLGFTVSPQLPFVLLQAARSVVDSIHAPKRLGIHICHRMDHYRNVVKVLATAILHYDLAANLVAVRDRHGRLKHCENSLFVHRLKMPSRTVDNAIYSLKRAGLYLSVERRTVSLEQPGAVRGCASIKRLNMYLFELLGLGHWASVQRNKARQRAEAKRRSGDGLPQPLAIYRRHDDRQREKRNQQRARARYQGLSQAGAAACVPDETATLLMRLASLINPTT